MDEEKQAHDQRMALRITKLTVFLFIFSFIVGLVVFILTKNVQFFPYFVGIGFFVNAGLTLYQKEKGYPGATYSTVFFYFYTAILQLWLSTV
jgi:hypothetical protein